LIVITFIDLEHQIIPDEFSLSGIVLGILLSLVGGPVIWWESILGVFIGGGIFLTIAWAYEKISGREGLGGGDVKMMAMLGAWFGIKGVFPIITLSTALGSVVGVFALLFFGKEMKTAIPFGPFLALASILYLFFEKPLLNLFFPLSV
jgi:leader peptidase (prepilin peptidase)/N-methyltransferase